MESNKDEALKCLSIAQKHRNAGNFPSARRFCQKSLALFATPEATKLLEIIEQESAAAPSEAEASSSSSSGAKANGTASSSGAETHPSASGTRHRHHPAEANGKPNGSASSSSGAEQQKKREYTPEQAAVVKRIRACKVTEYYEIMSLKKDCEEADVKKAYRKVRHEAHKMNVQRCLSDVSSWLCRCILIRTVHREQTRLSRVRLSHSRKFMTPS